MTISERLASLSTEVAALESELTAQKEGCIALAAALDERNARIADLEKQLRELTQPQPPPPPPPPVIVGPEAPDVLIRFAGADWRPQGLGELWSPSGERRWTWDPTKDVRVVLDAAGAQNGVILRRAWGDLPVDAPVEEHPVTVTINGKKRYDAPVRVHHHQGARMVFDRQLSPRSSTFRTPNYVIPPERMELLRAEVAGGITGKRWEWKRWQDLNPVSAFDPWTEDYGLSVWSWVGGIPLANEASMFPPWDIALLKTGDPALWSYIAPTWDSSGLYAMHVYDKATGEPCRPETLPATVPSLNPDNLPKLVSRSGLELPRGDLAHNFGLTSLAALLTGQRFYVEELESWALLGPIARKGALRASGIYDSGQVRATAWFLRDLYHLHAALPAGTKKEEVWKQLAANLRHLSDFYATPGAAGFHPTGIIATSPFEKDAPWSQGSTPGRQTRSGNHYFLAHVLSEIRQADIGLEALAEPILRHVLKVACGTWEHSRTIFEAPWLKHVLGADWPETIKLTFGTSAPRRSIANPVTPDIFAWWRSALVAGVELGEPWASPALTAADKALKESGRQISISWMIEPRSR